MRGTPWKGRRHSPPHRNTGRAQPALQFFDVFLAAVGQRVAAVIEARPGHEVELDDLVSHGRKFLAGYKLPKQIHMVEVIVRSPSGKPDYQWAKRIALGEE